MTREDAKNLFRNDKDSYGKPRGVMHKIDLIYDSLDSEALELLEWIADCPYTFDQATIPKKGIESAPQQVVLNLSLSYVKWKQLQNLIK